MRAEGELYRDARIRAENKYNEKRKYNRAADKRWEAPFRAKTRADARTYRQRVKAQAIAAYGGKCACCAEAELEFLGLDHPNGNGLAHRTAIGNGCAFYIALRRSGWPVNPPLRVLCHNCNMATRYGRICPHQKEAP